MLDQVSREIILWILSLLNTEDYTHMVLVCRTWYSLFISHLFRHVRLPLNEVFFLFLLFAYKPTTPLWEILPHSLRHLFIADCLVYCLQPLCAELESLSLQAGQCTSTSDSLCSVCFC
ncbi:hypothetical protein BO99DRAFT_12159 [Aspergillus violaceofuscus CBS 115571]|uniref:F-box domain-containing protein n=1 Tax=Aspergillus violaceofuscus (strain CBS 115571) TaxID=1450538 RepID=A0A2V5HS83_ASPV1|nr:hypothetical protein BO99DRAFT_12159 [Aspergillus violaceofuscus CBS 115571]